ncbi:MAG TPA: hypothetical protein VG819_11250 [Rhizomicrobium sp.]|jgi:hypothetical protein|nr:hypothetical protein [Rhizomicrobium sp.]
MLHLSVLLAAAAAAAAPPPAPPPCAGAEHHRLDFWIGSWNVYRAADNVRVGTSRIESVMGGCGIGEHFEAPDAPGGPYSGTSYSGYDRKDGKWHQMYVDTNGNVVWFTGGMEGNDLSLQAAGPKGSLRRMVYRPLPGGAVEQTGTVSTDGGASWQPGYDYIYRKNPPPR